MALGRMRTEQLRLGVVLEHIDRHTIPQTVLELLDDAHRNLTDAGDQLETFIENSVIHAVPTRDTARTPCCKRTMWELPAHHRISEHRSQVTCPGGEV